jgi:hypothetical protein
MADKRCQVDAQVLNELQRALLHCHWQGATEEWLLAVVREDCAKWRAGRLPAAPAQATIKMENEPNVPGAWMCEHLGIGPSSLQPGNVVFCEACSTKYDQGAALVCDDGHMLMPTGKGRGWVKVNPAKAGA